MSGLSPEVVARDSAELTSMGEELLRIGREMAGGKKGATAESGGGGGAAGAGEDGRRHGTESGGVGSSGSGAAAEKAEEEASHAMFPWESAGAAAVKAATDAAASPPRAPTPSRDSAAGGGGAGSNSYMAGQGVASVSGVSPARPGTGVAAGAAAPSYSGLHGVAAGLGRVAGNLSSSAATPSYGGAYGVGVPAVDAVGSSYLGASPGAAMVPGIGSGVSANSRAVLGALRALQEKIKKLEGERAHYREECARLESALSETRATADHDRAAMEANSRVEMTRARAAYGKLLAERNELQQDIVRDKEARKALRREMEILQDQIVSLSSEKRAAEARAEKFESQARQATAALQETRNRVVALETQASSTTDAVAVATHESHAVQSRMEEALSAERAAHAATVDKLTRTEAVLRNILAINENLVSSIGANPPAPKRKKKKLKGKKKVVRRGRSRVSKARRGTVHTQLRAANYGDVPFILGSSLNTHNLIGATQKTLHIERSHSPNAVGRYPGAHAAGAAAGSRTGGGGGAGGSADASAQAVAAAAAATETARALTYADAGAAAQAAGQFDNLPAQPSYAPPPQAAAPVAAPVAAPPPQAPAEVVAPQHTLAVSYASAPQHAAPGSYSAAPVPVAETYSDAAAAGVYGSAAPPPAAPGQPPYATDAALATQAELQAAGAAAQAAAQGYPAPVSGAAFEEDPAGDWSDSGDARDGDGGRHPRAPAAAHSDDGGSSRSSETGNGAARGAAPTLPPASGSSRAHLPERDTGAVIRDLEAEFEELSQRYTQLLRAASGVGSGEPGARAAELNDVIEEMQRKGHQLFLLRRSVETVKHERERSPVHSPEASRRKVAALRTLQHFRELQMSES